MELDLAREILSLLGISGTVALVIALGTTIIVNLITYALQRQIDFDRERKIAELQNNFDKATRRLEANLDVRNHVSRAQFDTEFAIYRELWRYIYDVRVRYGLYVIVAREVYIDGSTAPDTDLKKRHHECITAKNQFTKFVDENLPFYSLEVAKELKTLHRLLDATDEIFKTKVENPSDYFKLCEEAQRRLYSTIQDVSVIIRERLASVTIVE